MSEELQQPAVIDLSALLTPISEESPSGENLRYSGLYDEIAEARRADKIAAQGEWQTEIKYADFRRVINLSVPALTSQTKDLQIASWLTEALTKEHGFVGFRDAIQLVTGLQDIFWETLHPEIDEGDMEGRANAISSIDTKVSDAILNAPFTAGEGFGYNDWEDSKRFDFPDNIEMLETEEQIRLNALKAQAEEERRVTGDRWRKSVSQTRRAFVEQVNFTFGECLAAVTELNRVIEERYERNQMPGLSNLRKALDAVNGQLQKLLEAKREEEPDEVEVEAAGETVDGEDVRVAAGGVATVAGAIQGRKDALKRLGDIADFFYKTEPHSPVSYLIQRAVKWGNMPLDSWLKDVIKDENVLFQLRETLGVPTTSEGEMMSESSY